MRTCVGCGGRATKTGLRRFVREAQRLCLDPEQRAAGRGGYLHPEGECLRRFARGKGTIRSLRWTPSAEERVRLAAAIERLSGDAR